MTRICYVCKSLKDDLEIARKTQNQNFAHSVYQRFNEHKKHGNTRNTKNIRHFERL
jgi:hypothetical protein